MATFTTPEPIEAAVKVPAGSIHLIASDREDTTVVVNPADFSNPEAAERVQVGLDGGRLGVKGPGLDGIRSLIGPRSRDSVEVTIELPERSAIDIAIGVGEVRLDGRFGDVHVRSGAGDVHLDTAAAVDAVTGAGNFTLAEASGAVQVTAAGDMRLGRVSGDAEVKNMNGKTWLREVTGRVRVNSANGDIHVERVHGDVSAKTANGSVEVLGVSRGSVTVVSGSGSLEIGVDKGTAAWVDARTKFGRVDNSLEVAEQPEQPDQAVEINARTSFGDIRIRRSPQSGVDT